MSDLKKNVWELDGWYDQTVAGDGSYYADNTFWSWGDNQIGALGQNQSAPVFVSSPTQIPGTTWTTKLNAGGPAFGAIKSDGTLWMWGRSDQGQLGQNDTADYSSPVQIPGTNWSRMLTKYSHASQDIGLIATKTDGTLWSWGNNTNGGFD